MLPRRCFLVFFAIALAIHPALPARAVEAVKLDSVLQCTVDTDLDALKQGKAGRIVVILTNLLGTPVQVENIMPIDSTYFSVIAEPSTPPSPRVVPAGMSIAVPMAVRPKRGAVIGVHPLALIVTAGWTEGKKRKTASTVLQQYVTLGVVGETGALAILGIPALVLAPGFLALGMFGLLRRQRAWWYVPRTDGFDVEDGAVPSMLSSKEPDFWIVAVLLSIALDSIATRFVPDLFDAYTLKTIVDVYLISTLLGLTAYGIWRWRSNGRLRAAEENFASKAIEETDGAVDVIRKLANSGGKLLAQRVGSLDPALRDCFVIGRRGGKSVIVPSIRIGRPLADDLLQRVGVLINQADVKGLSRTLSEPSIAEGGAVEFAGAGGHVTLKELPGEPTGPSLRFVTL